MQRQYRQYNLASKSIAYIFYILFTTLFFPSCHISSNQSYSNPSIQASTSKKLVKTTQPITHHWTNQELATQDGHLVTFHEENNRLQAEVRMNTAQGFSKTYIKLPVYVKKDEDISKIIQLNKKQQAQLIDLKFPTSKQPGYIYIGKRGLLGGMKNEEGEKEDEKELDQSVRSSQIFPRLDKIKELYKYFYKRYFEITPKNYKELVNFSKKYEFSFESYEGGIYVKDWEDNEELHALIDLLYVFSRIKKMKVNCIQEDQPGIAETIARAIQFYEKLEELDLTGCQLGEELMEDIVASIAIPDKLKILNLSNDHKLNSELIAKLGDRFTNLQLKIQEETSKSNSTSNQNSSLSVEKEETIKKEETIQKESKPHTLTEGVTAYERLHLNKFLAVIPKEDIEYGEKIGRGSMGIVFQATYQGEVVAVKKLLYCAPEKVASFQKEAAIMSNHRHKSIISFFGYCPEQHALIMEYASGGSLWNLLKSGKKISWQDRYEIALDIAEGLNYLHECGIVHCDLKSENILLDSKQRAKITDFGMAALRNDHVTDGESSYGTWSGGTYRWMAPELFCQGSKNSKAGDVYSYGMVLWQLGSRKEPYATINSLPQLAKHIAENNNEIISLNTPQAIKKVIELCWLPEPPLKQVTDTRQRPTMKQVRRMLEKGLEEEDEKEKEKEKSIPKLEKKKAKLDKKQTEKEKKKEQKQEKKKKEKRKKNETEKKEEKEKKLTNKPSSVGTLKRWSNTKQIEHSIKKWPKGEKILKQLKTPNEILDLSNHKLTDFQLSLLIKHPTFSQFHTLVLYDNQISAEGADYLAKALSNSKIHTLDLSDNQVGVEGIRKIAFALPAHIRSIDLSGNQIGNEGVKSLAKVLANTDTCKLDLSSNQISTAGIIKLALTLPKTQIDQLSLYYNQIDSQGISKLAEILPHTKIRTLDLGKNQVSLDLQLLLKEKNPSIKFIF